MGVMDKFINAMKLNDEEDDYYDDDYYDEPEPARKSSPIKEDITTEEEKPVKGLDVEIAQRIIDFTSGSCFAMSGNLQKISHYIFIITPASVDISGDFQDILSGSFDVPINKGI